MLPLNPWVRSSPPPRPGHPQRTTNESERERRDDTLGLPERRAARPGTRLLDSSEQAEDPVEARLNEEFLEPAGISASSPRRVARSTALLLSPEA